jgi:hypothetical protein
MPARKRSARAQLPKEPCVVCRTPDAVRRRLDRTPFWLCTDCHPLAARRFNPWRGRDHKRRVAVPTKDEWIKALANAWDAAVRCFRCQISGVMLKVSDPSSPRYPTLEHSTPSTGHGGWMVVAAAINDIKSDLNFDEFRAAIRLLADIVAGSSRTASADLQQLLDGLKHWRRTTPAVALLPQTPEHTGHVTPDQTT